MNIRVRYFASLADMRGVEEEQLIVEDSCTAKSLYTDLKKKYNFSFKQSEIRVVINHEYKDFLYKLTHGDLVVFISPVSGG